MAIPDREDRAAQAKAEVARAEQRRAQAARRRARRARLRAQATAKADRKRVADQRTSTATRDVPMSRQERRQVARQQEKDKPKKPEPREGRKPQLRSGGLNLGGLKNLGKAALGDVKEIGYGVADATADYGTAIAKDIAADPRDVPFKHTGRLVAKDALGLVGAYETAIPEPKWLPKWARKELITVDPENVSIGRGSGKVDEDDSKRAKRFWKENPLLGALLVTPAASAVTRRGSRGAIEGSVKRANPEMPKREARKIARKESRMPGYAAAHGVKGGIAPRKIVGEYGEATARPLSRHPVGRAGQRAFDRSSELVEARFGPGTKLSTSQRAARMKERELRKATSQREAKVVRHERIMRKGIGRLGRSRTGQEALIATLEAPRGLSPRQAVETKLRDLRSTIERPRSNDEATARVAALERELRTNLRPLVDEAFPVGSRRREQALRNARPRGKRAQRGIETELELTGIRGTREQGGSVLEDAYERIEAQIAELAAKPDADPVVRKVAAMIDERDSLRRELSDLDVVFGDAAGDFGKTGAKPVAAKRLDAQVKALEKALASGLVDSDDFVLAVDAAETLSRQADESAKSVLGMADDELASRRNLVARRYAEKGLLPEGVEPEARGFFPHREEYEAVGGSRGAPTLAATGGVIGRPTPGRAFERRQNELRLYEQGRVQTSPRVLSNTVRQRGRYQATLEARGYLYEQGSPIRQGEPVPEGFMLVRNPQSAPEQIPPSVRAAIENPELYAELTERAGGFPEPETFAGWVDSWLYRGQGPQPEWLADLDNVRAVPEGVARSLLADVFSSAPRGSIASIFGTLNALARAVTIYTPFLGARYVARNTPQNMILLAMTRPSAFLNLRQAVTRIRRSDRELYDAIRVEAGTVPAAAGLPELAGRKQALAQKVEERAVTASRSFANVLGEVTDEPWRVSSWLGYAKAYGFSKPSEWRRLMTSDDPALVRVRDDIAQRVRDDMIDFDSLSPFERETLSRFLFIYPFKRGALKWPFMYFREYPVRASVMSLIAAQHEREETPGRVTSVLEAGRTEIGGREVDLGWLNPAAPAAETIEDLTKSAKGLDPRDGSIELRPLAGMLSPQYRSATDALGFGEPVEQVARAFAPGYSTVEKVGRGGGAGEQALRLLGSTVDYVEGGASSAERARAKVRKEAQQVMAGLRANFPEELRDPEVRQALRQTFSRKQAVDVVRAEVEREHPPGIERERAKYERELDLLVKWGSFTAPQAATAKRAAAKADVDTLKDWRRWLTDNSFDDAYLETLREVREAAGVGG